jgi:hypothetical protein
MHLINRLGEASYSLQIDELCGLFGTRTAHYQLQVEQEGRVLYINWLGIQNSKPPRTVNILTFVGYEKLYFGR